MAEEKRRKNDFISGVFILSLSAVIVKIIGLVYKIPMLKLLGSEGMGYFNSAYELYSLFCVIATSGLPVAMSVMISSGGLEKNQGANRIFKVALRLFLVLGFVGMLSLLGFARPFAEFLGSESGLYSIIAIAPTVLLICLSSAYRGYFQGLGQMSPTAVSQIIEAAGKLVLGLILAYFALQVGAGVEETASMAAIGLTLGTAVSVVYLALKKRRCNDISTAEDRKSGKILAELMKTAVPVTLSASVISVTKVIDMTMILRRMQDLGHSAETAFAVYGNYTTLALPLFSLAPALVTSVAMPLIPTLSRAISERDGEAEMSAVGEAIRLTALVSAPVSVGLTLFSKPILSLLFNGEYEAIADSSPLLSILGVSVLLSGLITVENAVLQSYKKASVPILSMVIGSTVKIGLAYFLIGIPQIGILGAPISTFVCDLIINAVNFAFIEKSLPARLSLKETVIKPFASALVAVVAARAVYNVAANGFGEGGIVALVSIGLAAVLYFVACILTGALKREEIALLSQKRRPRIAAQKN